MHTVEKPSANPQASDARARRGGQDKTESHVKPPTRRGETETCRWCVFPRDSRIESQARGSFTHDARRYSCEKHQAGRFPHNSNPDAQRSAPKPKRQNKRPLETPSLSGGGASAFATQFDQIHSVPCGSSASEQTARNSRRHRPPKLRPQKRPGHAFLAKGGQDAPRRAANEGSQGKLPRG